MTSVRTFQPTPKFPAPIHEWARRRAPARASEATATVLMHPNGTLKTLCGNLHHVISETRGRFRLKEELTWQGLWLFLQPFLCEHPRLIFVRKFPGPGAPSFRDGRRKSRARTGRERGRLGFYFPSPLALGLGSINGAAPPLSPRPLALAISPLVSWSRRPPFPAACFTDARWRRLSVSFLRFLLPLNRVL